MLDWKGPDHVFISLFGVRQQSSWPSNLNSRCILRLELDADSAGSWGKVSGGVCRYSFVLCACSVLRKFGLRRPNQERWWGERSCLAPGPWTTKLYRRLAKAWQPSSANYVILHRTYGSWSKSSVCSRAGKSQRSRDAGACSGSQPVAGRRSNLRALDRGLPRSPERGPSAFHAKCVGTVRCCQSQTVCCSLSLRQ